VILQRSLLRQSPHSFSLRAMSTAPKHHFLVYAPDNTDPDAFSRRMSVRARHLADAGKDIDSGMIKVAGGILTPESITGAERKIVGSTFIVEADTIETVRERFERDLYWTENVWDKEKIVIAPFLPAKI